MKRISEEVWKTLPRKPLAIYLKFRKEKLVEFEGLDNKSERIKKEWKELSKDIKDGMTQQYQSDLQTFNEEIQKWKELHGVTEAEIIGRLKRQKKAEAGIKEEQLRNDGKAFSKHIVREVQKQLWHMRWRLFNKGSKDEYREWCERLRTGLNTMLDHQLR